MLGFGVKRGSWLIQKQNQRVVTHEAAGTGIPGNGQDGVQAIFSQLNQPTALAVDAAGTLYIAELGAGRIRKVTPDGIIATVPGATQLRGIEGLLSTLPGTSIFLKLQIIASVKWRLTEQSTPWPESERPARRVMAALQSLGDATRRQSSRSIPRCPVAN